MRKLSLATLILFAFVVAQAQNTPSAGTSSGATGQAPSGNSAQAPAAGEMSSNAVQGCLNGASPNFTLTDTAGTTYNLKFPQNADTSALNQHVGESVQVDGTFENSGSSASSGQRSITVTRVGRGTGTCGAGAGAKTPAK